MTGSESAEREVSGAGTGGSGLEIRVLGPVEIAWDGRPVDIGGVKARALVARLLIDRQIIVSVDRLVDSLWGDNDGPGAEIALRSTVSRLRKRLRDAGRAARPDRDAGPGLRPGGARRGDRCRAARTAGGRGPPAAGAAAPERVRPADGRGRRALARSGLQRGPRRAVRRGPKRAGSRSWRWRPPRRGWTPS